MDYKQKNRPKLKIPYCPEKSGSKGYYKINTIEEKLVADYANLSFAEVDSLDVVEYWKLLRDAVIYGYNQTKEGREYLEKCWLLEQTEADRTSLRKYFHK